MKDYSNIYDTIVKEREENKRRNFNTFMNNVVFGLENELNEQYKKGLSNSDEMEKYIKQVASIKKRGPFRVLRNSKGLHKIEII